VSLLQNVVTREFPPLTTIFLACLWQKGFLDPPLPEGAQLRLFHPSFFESPTARIFRTRRVVFLLRRHLFLFSLGTFSFFFLQKSHFVPVKNNPATAPLSWTLSLPRDKERTFFKQALTPLFCRVRETVFSPPHTIEGFLKGGRRADFSFFSQFLLLVRTCLLPPFSTLVKKR